MPAPLVECVPNFSEGRDRDTLNALRAALTSVPGVTLLDVQADPSHNRSVFTLVARPDAAVEAAFRGMRVATQRIDLTKHRGEHPRMGATDVVPFVPVRDVTMEDCVALARRLGERAADELGVPIYLYARAATRPERERLPDVRKSEVIGLIPERGILGAGAAYLKLPDAADRLLEARIRALEGPTLDGWVEELAGGAPVPGGGSAAALAGALAAALVAMVGRLTLGRKAYASAQQRVSAIVAEADALRGQLRRLVDEDAAAYSRVSAAHRLPKEDPGRRRAVDEALVGAAQTPLQMARGAVRLLGLAREIETIGNQNARSDARVGAALARAALAGAVENVRVNVAALSEPGWGKALLQEAEALERVSPPS